MATSEAVGTCVPRLSQYNSYDLEAPTDHFAAVDPLRDATFPRRSVEASVNAKTRRSKDGRRRANGEAILRTDNRVAEVVEAETLMAEQQQLPRRNQVG
ncbi:unnamed protein product [Protopolystoma xenopodis]|uniref:Uncharacterized protein n=1 Tax=Protopolystoma xenopodis TaxID=117903 RepID=A0A3S5A287_9PLAT|nr:unnamed protein product [Protopolystoma xenopodis]